MEAGIAYTQYPSGPCGQGTRPAAPATRTSRPTRLRASRALTALQGASMPSEDSPSEARPDRDGFDCWSLADSLAELQPARVRTVRLTTAARHRRCMHPLSIMRVQVVAAIELRSTSSLRR